MSMNISVYFLLAMLIIALMARIWIGRSVKWMMADTESRLPQSHEESEWQEECPHVGKALCSPVSGSVKGLGEERPRGVALQPEQGLLYAPVSGKILRLFPLGNRMLIRSDMGIELLLSVGEAGDEMHSEYYRSHVLQNEIVTKGKLLLEFDLERMCVDGVDTLVSLTLEDGNWCQTVDCTRKPRVKSGEEILWVREQGGLA